MAYKLTVDGGLLRVVPLLPSVQTLKSWEAEGKIEIFEADRPRESNLAYGWPGGPTRPAVSPEAKRSKAKVAKPSKDSNVTFGQLSLVLFPQRDPRKLNMTELNDVSHLIKHHTSGNFAFVTTNVGNFIADGRQQRLKSSFKIVVVTPDEVVAMLRELENWGDSERPARKSSGSKRA